MNKYLNFCYVILVCIGIANAISIPMMSSNLSIWLAESGFDNDMIGYFSLLGLPAGIKLLTVPLIDYTTLPFFRSSPRKGWLFFALSAMALCMCIIGLSDPHTSPGLLIFGLFTLSLFSGLLYTTGLAYELESVDSTLYSMASASVITGYRIGLLAAGAGALYIAHLYSWQTLFFTMGVFLSAVALFVLSAPEPFRSHAVLEKKRHALKEASQHRSMLHTIVHDVLIQPLKTLYQRPNIAIIALFLLIFKTPDQLFKAMEGPFYIHIGFDKADLAFASKACGFVATVSGAFLAGLYLKNRDPLLSATCIGIIHALSLVGYWLQAVIGKDYTLLYATSAAANLTGGMAMTAVITLMWRVCDPRFSAVQYTLMWTLFSWKADLLGCLGGILANSLSWDFFFFIITLSGITIYTLLFLFIQKRRINVVLHS